jgi:5-methylcytosine-specific restriction enzyme subunit McrC
MNPAFHPCTLVLTERMPRLVRLPHADVAFLLENHRGHIEVLPTLRRNRYRLTALGCAGVLLTPGCRLVIRPKIPLANLFAMVDPLAPLPATTAAGTPETGTEILDFLAGQFASRLAERTAAGLHRGYRERAEQGPVLHGPLDLAAQLREGPGRKDQLHGRYDDFTADVPWNQVLKGTLELLLGSPLPSPVVRAALQSALRAFEDVQSVSLTPEVWSNLPLERLPAEYRPLVALGRLLADGLMPGAAGGVLPAPAFLLNLEQVFEQYLTRCILATFAADTRYHVHVQPTHLVSRPADERPGMTIRPDLTIDRGNQPVLLVDAKWKRLPPTSLLTADVYQVLAYGTTLGARAVVLVYPGQRTRVQDYTFVGSPLRLVVYKMRVTGSPEACGRSLRQFVRSLKQALSCS